MTHPLSGNWRVGKAFDLHTLFSVYIGDNEFGHPQFDNTYSEMGKLVHQLKYENDREAVGRIVELLNDVDGIENFDFLIPAPSSNVRPRQPVDLIAEALGARRGVTVLTGFLKKASGGTQLKNVDDPAEREKLLKDAIKIVGTQDIACKAVLLVDDLYRSGATLNACSAILQEQAGAADVCVLTMTKTRSKR